MVPLGWVVYCELAITDIKWRDGVSVAMMGTGGRGPCSGEGFGPSLSGGGDASGQDPVAGARLWVAMARGGDWLTAIAPEKNHTEESTPHPIEG